MAEPVLILVAVTPPYQQIQSFPDQLAWPSTRGMEERKEREREREKDLSETLYAYVLKEKYPWPCA